MPTTARKLLALARTRIGDAYHLGTLVPKDNPDWHGPWDCAEFASWCVYQTTGSLFGCRPRNGKPHDADAWTGWWMEDAKALGEVITPGQAAATPGAFLLRVGEAGLVGHVVISAGGGKTVEAASTKLGVIEGKADGRHWTVGVLVPGIDVTIGDPEPPVRPSLILSLKNPPLSGDLVKDLQRALARAGFSPGPPDGAYGSHTAAAVQAFQAARGLVPDGAVGPATARTLGIRWY